VGFEMIRLLASEGVIREGIPGRFPREDVALVRAAGEYLTLGGDIRALRAIRHAAEQEAERLRTAVASLKAKGAREEAADAYRNRSEAAASFFSAIINRESSD
jgi:hypothetical protein